MPNNLPHIIGLAFSISLLSTAFVYLLISDSSQSSDKSQDNSYQQRCLVFFGLTFFGLLSLFMTFSISADQLIESVVKIAESGTVANFTIIAFVLTIATGVIWTSIKETEKRAKDQIYELTIIAIKLEDRAEELKNFEKSIEETVSKQNVIIGTVSLLELKSKYYTHYYHRLDDIQQNETIANQRKQIVQLNRLVEFLELDIDNIELHNAFLKEFKEDTNQFLQKDNKACRYLEKLANYYTNKEPSENNLKLIRLCQEIGQFSTD